MADKHRTGFAAAGAIRRCHQVGGSETAGTQAVAHCAIDLGTREFVNEIQSGGPCPRTGSAISNLLD
jgi:hypothetical protein